MIGVNLYKPDEIRDESFKYAVIAARYEDKWVFCRHKERNTWEIPGGHLEPGEKIEETARRELAEETGARETELWPAAAYGVVRESGESFGMLFFARIHSKGDLPQDSEIGEIRLFDEMPGKLTYPEIQPHLYNAILRWLNEKEQEGRNG